MRTEKRSAFLSGLCGVAVAFGLMASAVQAETTVTTERGASILAFPKVLANSDADTLIQITSTSNMPQHAHCFYVNAAPDDFGNPQWQVTDFAIWLTSQQPTHWVVSEGRFVNPTDTCIENGKIQPSVKCANAGLDPGAIPPVPDNFTGELKCIQVDQFGDLRSGNHFIGQATIITSDDDVSKYNAVGIQSTDLVNPEDIELRLDQPSGTDEEVGQYAACPNRLLLNHLAEGVTSPVIYANGRGGVCSSGGAPCYSDADCTSGTCNGAASVTTSLSGVDLVSATVTDLTLIPCTQDFENLFNPETDAVTVQFEIYNEFEQKLSASTTVECWANFYLFEVDSPNDPERSVFSFPTLGTVAAHTRITPNPEDGGVVGVAGVTRANSSGFLTRTALNIHMEGDRFSASDGEVVDVITVPAR
jgi:hypothetical protein